MENGDFNPHEREARDVRCQQHVATARDFNPHEREARDVTPPFFIYQIIILIHTSVKLVTFAPPRSRWRFRHFNPHEREARDPPPPGSARQVRNFNPHEREARDTESARASFLSAAF